MLEHTPPKATLDPPGAHPVAHVLYPLRLEFCFDRIRAPHRCTTRTNASVFFDVVDGLACGTNARGFALDPCA